MPFVFVTVIVAFLTIRGIKENSAILQKREIGELYNG
jgi:hypothetical protein